MAVRRRSSHFGKREVRLILIRFRLPVFDAGGNADGRKVVEALAEMLPLEPPTIQEPENPVAILERDMPPRLPSSSGDNIAPRRLDHEVTGRSLFLAIADYLCIGQA